MESTPKIIDACIFYNENDVMDIRFQELDPVVDAFVILMADHTFRGDSKPNYFDYKRFEKYKHKAYPMVLNMDHIGEYQELKTTWDREIAQRNWLRVAVADISNRLKWDNDFTVIFGDVDEIPRRSVVRPVEEMYRFRLDKFSYAINMLTDEENIACLMVPYWQFFHNDAESLRRSSDGIMINNAGWEFSSLGTPDEIMQKFKAFSHDEFDHMISPEYFAKQILEGKDLLDRDIGMQLVEVDESWPKAILRDRAYWAKYELYLEGDTKCYPLDL